MSYGLADSFPSPIIVITGGVIVSVNHAFLNKFGYSRREVMGKSPLAFINADIALLVKEAIDGDHDRPVQSTVVHKRGQLIPVEIEGRDLVSDDNKSRLVSVRDVTGFRELEDDLHRALEHSKQFAYVAAHDLKGPLRAILGYAELLYGRLTDLGTNDPQAMQYLQEISTSCERMDCLIRDLLKLADVDSGDLDDVVDLNEAARIARKSVEIYLDESGASLVLPSDMPTVRGCTSMLADLFHNLFSNALKYRSQNRGLKIAVTWERHKDLFVIRVTDNGIGFDPKHRDLIFKMFKRLHTDRFQGTGVGLAICQRIVERHGGTIWADSEPNVGSIFSFTLPMS